ncbi:hypothetical protein R3P38DRAFT_909714 [Favolaschia claudopus]|uniref:F-box domain-containing protein n=1 Tax=Favolaschia claudopus TaxID=2862362 RepID=A0AAV9YZL3_9AGAR
MERNPLDIQELLDRCIDCLAESTPSLLACALVARSWVYTAQSRIFRAPHVTLEDHPSREEDARLLDFQNTLLAFPHLVRHVHELCLSHSLHGTTVEKLCNIPFSHLESLLLELTGHTDISRLKSLIKPLYSLRTLRSLSLDLTVGYPCAVPLLEGFPPTIDHLEVFCYRWNRNVGNPMPTTACEQVSFIPLKSLVLAVGRDDGPQSLDSSALYPFDLSRLKSLQVETGEYIPWKTIPKQRIEMLEFKRLSRKSSIDLSAFPNLKLIRFNLPNTLPPGPRLALEKIQPSNRIQIVQFSLGDCAFDEFKVECEELDRVLALCPVSPLPVVEFEAYEAMPGVEEILRNFFPRIVEQNQFRIAYRSSVMAISWWKDKVAVEY